MLIGAGKFRRAFTLAEVMIAMALIAILAAVMIPTIRGRMQDSYESAIVEEFTNLATGIQAYRQDVGSYPPALDYLSALRASPVDRCNVALSASAIANYRGPYLSRTIANTSSYLFAQKDTVLDVLTLNSSPPPVGIFIRIEGPDTLTAHNVDIKIDGVANQTAGQVRWTANGTDVFLDYIIPMKSGSC
jgi:prepilin-type N-terminal cleavage/methylation domain-containing protein